VPEPSVGVLLAVPRLAEKEIGQFGLSARSSKKQGFTVMLSKQ